jgi:3-(3-hydroxy-phenyl)propionate hydroxylase
MPHSSPRYPARPAPAHDERRRHGAVIAGGGLVGLTLALDLARRGIPSVLLDDDDTVSTGSRAICVAKRSLEIFGRLGLGERMLAKGVTWSRGRVFFQDRAIYEFDLLPEQGHEYPAFINLQQYYAEEWLVEACAATGLVDLRWRHEVAGVVPHPDGVALRVKTPGGDYALHANWLLACDGAHSFVRRAMGLPFTGRAFQDRFLIADVVMEAEFPAERWFWFDPPFHRGQSALLHKQPDGVWRIDLQLGPDADPEAERQPERVIPRIRAMLGSVLGPERAFELEWVSVYAFCCRRLERFVHGRVVFVGDSAHQVSPFGARGGNGGVQDADNLGWKLAAVLRGDAPERLIASYDAERIPAADANILNSTRSTDFITPKTQAARAYRDAVLMLAERHAFARPLVNSGRLSRPSRFPTSPLNAPGCDTWDAGPGGGVPPGTPALDAPVLRDGRADWLLRHIGADGGFTLVVFGDAATPIPGLATVLVSPGPVPATPGVVVLEDQSGLAASRYAAPGGAAILFRPDQHCCARFRAYDPARVVAAMRHALGFDQIAAAAAA